MWSPRPRGWSLNDPAQRRRGTVVPAPAGVVPTSRYPSPSPTGGPRARRGGPQPAQNGTWGRTWSPRPRGWSRPDRPHDPYGRVVPAPAGVVPSDHRSSNASECGPRARGGGPPHTGCERRRHGGPRASGGSPTHSPTTAPKPCWSPHPQRWDSSQRASVTHSVLSWLPGPYWWPLGCLNLRDDQRDAHSCGGPGLKVVGTLQGE